MELLGPTERIEWKPAHHLSIGLEMAHAGHAKHRRVDMGNSTKGLLKVEGINRNNDDNPPCFFFRLETHAILI